MFPHQERYLTTDQLDDMATAAGLTLIDRSADWKRTPYASNRTHVSTYPRSRPDPRTCLNLSLRSELARR